MSIQNRLSEGLILVSSRLYSFTWNSALVVTFSCLLPINKKQIKMQSYYKDSLAINVLLVSNLLIYEGMNDSPSSQNSYYLVDDDDDDDGFWILLGMDGRVAVGVAVAG
jgi:uncharacterized membrane protein